MYSGNSTPPSFPSAVIETIDQEQPQVADTTIDPPAFGGSVGNIPMVPDIQAPPLSYSDFIDGQQNSRNPFQPGTLSRELDGYSTGSQPPSIGAMRGFVVSQPSGSNLIYTDGQPPSLNDIGRRATSQTGPSSTVREVPDPLEMAGMSLTGNNFRRLYPNTFSNGEE